MKTHITLNLEFAGVILPTSQSEKGEGIVPVKLISDIFGLSWKRQYRRLQTPYFTRRLGVCMGHMAHAGQSREMVCIRIDRVEAYLNSLSPESVRAVGNIDGAEFLEAKQSEWDDVIHAYEKAKGLAAPQSDKHRTRSLYLSACRAAHASGNRADVLAIRDDLAQELGYVVQQQLPSGMDS